MRILRLYLVLIVLVLLITAWYGQCGIFAQGLGFQLRGPLTFGGFVSGEVMWTVGKFKIVTNDPTLHRRFEELEGQRILITVERAPK